MGRKKQEPAPVAEPEETGNRPGGRTIGAWLDDAFSKGGNDAEVAELVNSYARDAGKDYTISVEEVAKKRAKREGGTTPRQRSQATVKQVATLDDLDRVAELIANEGYRLADFAKQVEEVERLAGEVGGLAILKQCVKALTRWSK